MPEPLSRREQKRIETRARIVRCAARAFAERGYEGVALEEVADIADVSRRTLYNYFDSKESLLEAIVLPAFRTGMGATVRSAECGDPREGVRQAIEVFVVTWREHKDAMRVAFTLRGDQLPTQLAGESGAQIGQMRRVFQRAAEAGWLIADDPWLAQRSLWQTAATLLEIYDAHPQGEEVFRRAAEGMLLRRRARARA